MEPTQDETILLSAHKNVWTNGIESERNVPLKKKKKSLYILVKNLVKWALCFLLG